MEEIQKPVEVTVIPGIKVLKGVPIEIEEQEDFCTPLKFIGNILHDNFSDYDGYAMFVMKDLNDGKYYEIQNITYCIEDDTVVVPLNKSGTEAEFSLLGFYQLARNSFIGIVWYNK